MAINYTNIFTPIGYFIHNVNFYKTTVLEAIPDIEAGLGALLEANEEFDTLNGFDAVHQGIMSNIVGWITSYGQMIGRELTSQERIVQFLPIPVGSSTSDTLVAIIRDMILNSQTVQRNVTTVGSVTADAANIGDAIVLTTKVLDGVTSPDQANSAPACPNYKGLDSELGVKTETMTLTCSNDSSSGTEGAETFGLIGGPRPRQPYDWLNDGSGTGPNIGVLNGNSLLQNGEFETWTVTNIPDNWVIASGVVTTNFLRESSSVKRGTYALAIKGDGSTATLEITQDMSNRGLQANKSYLVGVWIKGQASTAAGTLTIAFTGTGYTAGSTEKITMNAAALSAATSYGVQYFQVNMPTIIPTDFKLSLKVTGTMTNTKNVFFDGMVVGPTIYHGGVGMGIIAGGTPIRKGDRYTFAVSNNNAGNFQTYFRKMFHVQLPSVASSPSISESLT